MVLSSFGVETMEADLRAMCDTIMSGTDALKAVEAARQLGFPGTGKHNLDLDELRALVDDGHFPIVYVNLYPIDGSYERHALVVVEISDEAAIVLDPMRGECRLPIETFCAAWRIQRNLTILVLR